MKRKKIESKPIKFEGVLDVYDDKNIMFNPTKNLISVNGFRRRGVVTMLSNGQMGFMATPKKHSTSKKLKRTIHGTLSENDDNYYLYIRIDKTETDDYKKVIKKEVKDLLDESLRDKTEIASR